MAELHPHPLDLPDHAVPGSPAGTVVVGYDGTPEAAEALEWATDWASLHGSRLMVACAADPGLTSGPSSVGAADVVAVRRAVGRVATRGADHARSARSELDVRSLGAVGHPSAELVALSGGAELVVVGRRTRQEHPTPSLGSVSFALSAHSRCPVVVVQGQRRLAEGRPVVVGVDGSRPALRAVAFAAEAARVAGAGLVVASAWSGGEVAPWLAELWDAAALEADPEAGHESAAAAVAGAAVAAVRRSHPDVEVTVRTARGSAPDVLLDEVRDAGLLVVGARGGGGFPGLLGSVSRSVVRLADLPVAVVRVGSV